MEPLQKIKKPIIKEYLMPISQSYAERLQLQLQLFPEFALQQCPIDNGNTGFPQILPIESLKEKYPSINIQEIPVCISGDKGACQQGQALMSKCLETFNKKQRSQIECPEYFNRAFYFLTASLAWIKTQNEKTNERFRIVFTSKSMEQLEKAEMTLKETAYQPRNYAMIGFKRRQANTEEENPEPAQGFSAFQDDLDQYDSDDERLDQVDKREAYDLILSGPNISKADKQELHEEKKEFDYQEGQIPTNIQGKIRTQESIKESLLKFINYMKRASEADLIFMEEINLTNINFLKDQLGLNLSNTLLIMDNCEDFGNRVEEQRTAEITSYQVNYLLGYFKSTLTAELSLSESEFQAEQSDLQQLLNLNQQEQKLIIEFITVLEVLDDLISDFNSYNFMLMTDENEEGQVYLGVRCRCFTDDIMKQIKLKTGKLIVFNSKQLLIQLH